MSIESDSSGGEDDLVASLDEVLDSYEEASSIKRRKVELEGTLNQDPNKLPCYVTCRHSKVFGGMCTDCGQRMTDDYGVDFGHVHKGLKVSHNEAKKLMIRQKKLHLVLDFDFTLLHSCNLQDLTREEQYLKHQTDSWQDASKGKLFMSTSMPKMMIKLRPFVKTFLKQVSTMFEMWIYTQDNQNYAKEMAKLLDPEGAYFNSRIFSRENSHHYNKSLDLVLRQDREVIILDDTEKFWPEHYKNFILMEEYQYFVLGKCPCIQCLNRKSHSVKKTDESETNGQLAVTLSVLKKIHSLYVNPKFDGNPVYRDIRCLLPMLRRSVLRGCTIFFSHIFPNDYLLKDSRIWEMAEELGARCSTRLDSSVTHVVSIEKRTKHFLWAVQRKKFLVHPNWLRASCCYWQRQPEDKFPISLRANMY